MVKDSSKIYMPMGIGGLVRYTEEEKVLIKLKPKHIIGGVIALVVIEMLVKFLIPI